MASTEPDLTNPLLTTRAPEAALSVQLHPLVLLTISDYITRHTSRQQSGPIIGAIIGQQNGRNFTLEHAYECKIAEKDGNVVLDQEWFLERLEQYKDVHKAPALDLVAIFMLSAEIGPNDEHRDMVAQVQVITGSDSVMLLLFHPEMVVEGLQGGKLPITLYESVKEQDAGTAEVELKFRELGFEVETGEAEMIGVDSVASGAGNASAVPKSDSATTAAAQTAAVTETTTKEKKPKGKGKAKEGDANAPNGTTSSNALSPEDEELIASLTAKANAIKMLNQRLTLIRAYLQSQPESYLTDATSTTNPHANETNHTLLRSINAMLSRLPLLTPPPAAPTNTDSAATSAPSKENTDVHLTTLLASLTRSISEAQSLGSKFHVYARDKANKERDRQGPRGKFGFDESSILLGDGGSGRSGGGP